MKPLPPQLLKVYAGLHKSSVLEKLGQFEEKKKNDLETFELIKRAAFTMDAAKQLLHTPFGRGLGFAAGAAIPTVMAGNAIANHATSEARNKALEAGLGLGGIGLGLYGLHRAMSPQKTASDVSEALEKLATIGYVDATLSNIDSDLAKEIKGLNAEYGCDLIRDLLK